MGSVGGGSAVAGFSSWSGILGALATGGCSTAVGTAGTAGVVATASGGAVAAAGASAIGGGIAASATVGGAAAAGVGGFFATAVGGVGAAGATAAGGGLLAAVAGGGTACAAGACAAGVVAVAAGSATAGAGVAVSAKSKDDVLGLLAVGAVLVGARVDTSFNVSWDCWKALIHDASSTPSLGKPVKDILIDHRISNATLEDGIILLRNIWNEFFKIQFVCLPWGQVAAHAMKIF